MADPSRPPAASASDDARAGRLHSLARTAPPGTAPAGAAGLRAPGVHELPGVPGALLAVPDGPVQPRPLLVFFHGAGGTAQQGLAAVRTPAQERGVLALLPASVAGTWDLVTGRTGPDIAALDAALGQVRRAHPVSGTALGGFSDGASYALSLGIANGDLVEAVLAFSPGFAAPPQQRGRPRVYVAHGTADAVLPVDRCGRAVVRRLRSAGYEVRYDEFDGPHTVRAQDVGASVSWWRAPFGEL